MNRQMTRNMKPQFKTILTNTAAVALSAIGLAAFFLLIGDETPDATMSVGEFVLTKGAAMAALAAVALVARKMYRHGDLPKWMTGQEDRA